MKPPSPPPLAAAALAVVALFAGGCSRLAVEWSAGDEEITFVARGPAEAGVVLVLAGPPNGPHTMPGDPSIWTTVGPDKPRRPGGVEVARAAFDANGVARASIKAAPGVAEVLVQAVALSRTETGRAIAVSDCVAVSREDGRLVIRPHWREVVLSPVWWSFAAAAGLFAAGFLLRRLRIPWARLRPLGLAAALAGAAFLALARVRAPADATSGPWPDPALPLVRAGVPPPASDDPVDRVTRPGFRQLVEGVRSHAPAGATISILPAGFEGPTWADSWQAAWLLWPRAIDVLAPGTDPFERRGVYLTLDGGPKKAGARILFRNAAGCLWAVDEGEPK
jgi:hypothetical protein